MRDFEGSAIIATSPDRLFNYLADPRHLPDYFPKALAAKSGTGEDLVITLDLLGETVELHSWYRVDTDRRVVQWGVPGAGYQGWIAISPDPGGCELTVSVQAPIGYEDDGEVDESTEAEIMDTIRGLRQIMKRPAAESPAG